jgi:hypothetical protein
VAFPKDRGRDLLQCNDERAGVMLLSWNWSVNLVLPLPFFSTIRGIDELNSIAVASFRRYRSYPLRYDDDELPSSGGSQGPGSCSPASNWSI